MHPLPQVVVSGASCIWHRDGGVSGEKTRAIFNIQLLLAKLQFPSISQAMYVVCYLRLIEKNCEVEILCVPADVEEARIYPISVVS